MLSCVFRISRGLGRASAGDTVCPDSSAEPEEVDGFLCAAVGLTGTAECCVICGVGVTVALYGDARVMKTEDTILLGGAADVMGLEGGTHT